MTQVVKKAPRIEVVDALRGFAVMAILLLHNIEHFIYPVYPTNSPKWLNILDKGVLDTGFTLFGGKAYAIFALLFGFTFYIQSNNQKVLGKDFGYRFLWRLLILALFATLNAAFFPAGDVLMLFVVVGGVLVLARNWSDKTVLIVAIFFLIQPVEWFFYIANLINPEFQLLDLNVGAMYGEVAEYTKSGNYKDFFIGNITLGQKASLLWAVGAGRFFQTAGLFLLGFFLGRKQIFVVDKNNLSLWIRILIISAILFAPLYSLKELIMQSSDVVQQTVGTVFDMWQKLAFTLVLISSFVILYENEKFRNMVSNFRFYGRMSLTNYVSQSILGAIIYFPIGLHLAPYCGYTVSLLIGFGMLFLQIRFCKWWLSKYRQGPLEYIWHKLTWIGRK